MSKLFPHPARILVTTLAPLSIVVACLLLLASCTTDNTYYSPWERQGRPAKPANQPPQQLAGIDNIMMPMPDTSSANGSKQNSQTDNSGQAYIDPTGYTYTPRQANTGTIQQPSSQPSLQKFPALRNHNAPKQQNAPAPAMVTRHAPISGPMVKVALLLPLSGPHKALGQSMQNAAQMALFEIGGRRLQIMPRDTKGTPEGAREAVRSAIADGAQLILGPVFAESVRAIKPIARSARLNVVAFTTDWSVAGGNVYIMGFLPHQQVERVIEYAASRGYSSFGVLAPRSDYGDIVVQSFHKTLSRIPYATEPMPPARYSPDSANISAIVRDFVDYDNRVEALEEERRKWKDDDSLEAEKILAELELMQTMGDPPFTAIMLAAGGDQVRALANLLRYYDINMNKVKLLGTGLWDDPTLPNEENMHGAWFAAPSPQNRIDFESRYVKTYGERPLRLATLAYDATALAAVLGHKGLVKRGRPAFDANHITNPNGFAGVDGIFRFSRAGVIERGLAVLEIRERGIFVIDPAPKSFQKKAKARMQQGLYQQGQNQTPERPAVTGDNERASYPKYQPSNQEPNHP